MYSASKDTYLSNHKASVLFIGETYEPRNDAEVGLLEIAVKQWKVKKIGEPQVAKSLDIKEQYEAKFGKKVPVNKKNDKEWIKSKLAE